MRKTIWTKMCDRMNLNFAKHPTTDPLVEVLKDLYTEEQASLVGDFPIGAYTPAALAQRLGREEDELNNMLTKMSRDGLIFEAASENGEAEYSVLPFIPGLIELQLLKGKDDEKTRKFNARFNELRVAEGALMAEAFKKDPERAKEVFPKTVLRAVAIEEQISADTEAADWERVSRIVESETSYAVGECSCKHVAKLNGEPCTCGVSSKCCVFFGKTADYLVERGYADRRTKEELYTLLKECEDAGLVHMSPNQKDHNVAMCNCCSCCCLMLKKHKAVRDLGLQVFEESNFTVRVDEDGCVGCGECVEYCIVDALSLSDDTIAHNATYCLGCGVCIDKCPTESLSLVRNSHKKLPEPEIPLAGGGPGI